MLLKRNATDNLCPAGDLQKCGYITSIVVEKMLIMASTLLLLTNLQYKMKQLAQSIEKNQPY
jgi:hypothetical protein